MKDQQAGGAGTARIDDTKTEGIDPQTLTNKSELKTEARGEQSETTAPDAEAEEVTGFAPFRAWCNKRLRQVAGDVRIEHASYRRKVTEITPDGQIRLEHGEEFALVPLDERYIPALLRQIL